MQRRHFLRVGLAGLAAPAALRAAGKPRVIVVGAGAAGVTAAHDLIQAGAEVTVLEAAPRWGGRVQRLRGFADFPIDLGGEWIHTDPDVLSEIAGRDVSGAVRTIRYNPQTYQLWHRKRLQDWPNLWPGYEEAKFHRSTWFGFFERFLWPIVAEHVRLSARVTHIDHSGPGVRVTAGGQTYAADRVIVTVPLGILKSGEIAFTPALPRSRVRGFKGFNFGEGFKVFMKFKERFYPDILLTQSWTSAMADTWDDKTYYDAAFGKGADTHLLGLHTASGLRSARAQMGKADLIADVLAELDQIYDGAASKLLIQAEARNWTQDPYIRGNYSMEYDYQEFDSIAALFAPLGDRVFFAGEAMGGDHQSTVHGAALSGRATARAVL
ncbi:amine oxidase [Candidatus Rhodobacter oscarellae]|uniref:Tryptophan 2-monooxygenase n=1 Tax=Candidatus Rhodobacter oscarellae TaxID=1675527 RepID=A0A0J9H497_9RHOB|nr:NAD(P)/FAD-dependent oxidoreductase [Candidatus Rhodobacter lobularis]KMW60498.1 amine oxidase [Candidatus Rhodobacter lobularis]